MLLRDALLRAAKFAAKEAKDQAIRAIHCVHCVPPADFQQDAAGGWWPTFPGYVTATDGDTGVMITIDPFEVVPDLTMRATSLAIAFKGTKKTTRFEIKTTGPSTARIDFQSGNKFVVPCTHGSEFPPLPEAPPELHRFEGWPHIKAVLHAAQKDTKDGHERPALQGVHFHPKWTEASDQYRVARTSLALTHEPRLVPARIFAQWPARKNDALGCAVGWHGEHAFFWAGGELRFTKCLDASTYFDLSAMLPDKHLGHRSIVDKMAFKQAVKHAQTSTVSQQVELRFGDAALSIQGIEADGEVKFAQTLPFPAAPSTDIVIARYRGKLLWDALHNIADDLVNVCYSTSTDPIRLEADRFVEAVWPLIKVEAPK